MKNSSLLTNEKRRAILLELEDSPKKFVVLKRATKFDSNFLAYNLNILIKEGLIEKKHPYYSLTDKAKYIVPYIPEYNDATKIPLPSVITILKKGNKVLVRKKQSEPDKGKSCFISTRLHLGESILDSAKRSVSKVAGVEIKNINIICVNNYTATNNGNIAHYIVFFLTAEPIGIPKEGKWKNYASIREEMVPDNKFILKSMLKNRNAKIIDSSYNQSSNKFKIVKVY